MQYIFSQDGDYVNFNGGGNLWRLHKNSRCVAWHWDETGDLFFDVYDLQFSVKAEHIGNVVIGGVTLTTAADFETNIVIVFPGLAGGSGGGSSYLSYVALLTQSGTDAPVAIVLENTLGGTVVWTRIFSGVYLATLAGAFPLDKTYYSVSANKGTGFLSMAQFSVGQNNQPDSLGLEVFDFEGNDVDGLLFDTPIEIRVYP